MALEYLAICEFSVKDGPITYIQELQAFRRETQICSACSGLTSSSVRRSLALPVSIVAPLSQTLLYALLGGSWPYWIRAKRNACRFQDAGPSPSTPSGKGKRLIGAVLEDPPLSKKTSVFLPQFTQTLRLRSAGDRGVLQLKLRSAGHAISS